MSNRTYFQIPEHEVRVMENSLFRMMPVDPAVHLYRPHVSPDRFPEQVGERESLAQVFGWKKQRRQRERVLAWLFQRRGISP